MSNMIHEIFSSCRPAPTPNSTDTFKLVGEKYGEFGKLSVIRQTKTIQILMAESIHSSNLSLPNAA